MTSDTAPGEAFVWIWLPDRTEPVVAGRLARVDGQFVFNYGRSYLQRQDAIPIYLPELPLRLGALPPAAGLTMPSCLRDAAPDAWGRRVILNRRFGRKGREVDTADIDELTYLLESGSDRIGALDFQASPTRYEPRQAAGATLEELLDAARRVEDGTPLTPELDQALFDGSSLGGARPKAMIVEGDKKYIAKFSSRTDVTNVVKGEFVAMRLAALVGLDVAHVELAKVDVKDVILIERFDREKVDAGWQRNAMVSALTLFGLDEMMARYASYEDLATIIRHRFTAPKETLRELFGRLVFNILCGNTDDHARNHAAFWTGKDLRLTPAYDICPQPRAGNEASQAMLITGDERSSRIAVCLEAAANFLLSPHDAAAVAEHQIRTITEGWPGLCRDAGLSEVERNLLWRRQILNPFAFEGAPMHLADLLAATDRPG
ncbi:MAG: type II toxin-antitoxin system HipA family toxin [Rhodoplanes sp.]|uniref:type II toxin-antitoxin system HipA family toxin n=1 Tax=Rhodoplanes sp. TaxID=1968906 RepID=UPI0017C77D09|nr:type II toxin-antitoxin system HipA family toxin [Rhodoplanes sp.]NVO14444.1 type II toxin-antitoxin system HipA family toxin [Rhodoplanes sp.]